MCKAMLTAVLRLQIIYCAGSRISFTGMFQRVENFGVSNIARCWLDTKHRLAQKARTRADVTKHKMANFQKGEAQDEWDMLFCGPLDANELAYKGQDQTDCFISEDELRLVFTGTPLACCLCAAHDCTQLYACKRTCAL
jgi:hypothetical protein